MNYAKLLVAISDNRKVLEQRLEASSHGLIKMVVADRQQAINRDNALYEAVQKQGLYMETYVEYDRRFWFIPKGMYWGRKLFKMIYDSKAIKLEDSMIEAGKEAQKAQEEKIKQMKEQQEKDNVSNSIIKL